MKTEPYHTNSDEYGPTNREVYHDHADCYEGEKIKPWHKEKGAANRPRCKVCISKG